MYLLDVQSCIKYSTELEKIKYLTKYSIQYVTYALGVDFPTVVGLCFVYTSL